MPNPVAPISSKSIAIIAVAVIFTIVMTIIISSSSRDFALTSIIPVSKKKAPAGQNQSDSPFKVLFANNGQTEIYKVQKDNKWSVIVNGQESAFYDAVDNPTFSPDGAQFAYSASLDGNEFVVLNNYPQEKKYTNIRQILFSSDGELLAYLADTENGSLVVVNGMEGKLYENIGTLETESGITFLVFTANNQVVYRAIDGPKTFIVVDTAEGKKYAEIKEIYLSADGSQIAYYAQEGDRLLTIIDGKVTHTQIIPPNTPATPAVSTSSSTSPNVKLGAKDSARNLSPDIDKQPDKLNPLICGQTTACNF